MINKINKEMKIIDLSSGYVVLGSGLNAIATIYGILDNKKNINKKIYVLDAGISSNENMLNLSNQVIMPSPKFKIKNNKYIYQDFNKALGIKSKEFHAVGSLAKGGLSNIWGAGIHPYNNKELTKFPYSLDEVKGIYSKIYNILTGIESDVVDEINDEYKKFRFFKPMLAINKHQNYHSTCKLASCDDGCISCNKNVFNSAYEIDKLIELKKIEYIPNLLINKIFEENKKNYIECKNLKTNKKMLIMADAIFSSLGSISSAKTLSKVANNHCKTDLLSTPGGSFFIFSYKKFHKLSHKILCSKSFSYQSSELNFEGNIFPFSKNLLINFFGNYLGGLASSIFGYLIFKRIFVVNVYFDSGLSSSEILFKKNNAYITTKFKSELTDAFKNALSVIKNKFAKKGLFIIPFSKKILAPGQDIHYAGTIPMKKNPKNNECDFNGKLYGSNKIFITDASSMPFLGPKGHTFNSMVNSYYIASKFITETDINKVKE